MSRKRLVKIITGILLLFAVFYSGYYLGNVSDKPADDLEVPEEGKSELIDSNFSLFWDAVRIVKNKFYKPDKISDQEILYGAIQGAMKSLEDPYSTFFKPSDAKKFEEDIEGSFGGIGAEIGIRDNQLIIVAPLKGNPAESVGLKAGDKILKVNDEYTSNFTVEDAVKNIRGEKGTDVNLLIMRDGWKEAKEFTITRDKIIIPTIEYEMKDNKIAYIQLFSFNGNAVSEFYQASFDLLLKSPKGLILDLRNNSGGYLQVANQLSGWFLDKGDIITKEKFRSGETRNFKARGNGAWSNIPIVLLVNSGSASASEILVGAVKYHHSNVTVVGETTFGKGTVQEVETLKDGSKIKVSVAEWLTPDDKSINENGIDPDVEVKIKDSDTKTDPQLQKALEIIREKSKDVKSIPTLIL
ncbi:MAG TPA: S41 family peptidase [Candidatus Paceibacterota bacterium]|nr:S41 family peptidase [Candidatus Paceibacterota bacterium]